VSGLNGEPPGPRPSGRVLLLWGMVLAAIVLGVWLGATLFAAWN
jgi:hypothetical protein